MKMIIAGIMSVLLLSGCAAIKTPIDEGYQLGDTAGSIINVQAKYCAETDPVKRAMYLAVIKSVVPTYPGRGACTSLIELVGKDTMKDMAEKVSDVEVEEAIKEQKEYQKKLEKSE